MKIGAALLLLVCMALPARGADSPESEEEKTLYALGLSIARNLALFSLKEPELDMVEKGLSDGVLGRSPEVPLETYMPKIQALAEARRGAAAAVEKKAGADFLKKAADEKGAVQTASGLVYKELQAGKGESPAAQSKVKVHYHGTLRDGTVFDSSVERKQPITLALNQVVPCWTEGLQKMKVGGKSRLVCPSSLAYGDRGAPPRIPPGAVLVFEVELLEIEK